MLLIIFNVCFVRNKIVDIFDFICESKVDFIVIIEIWFIKNDLVVKVELCFVGYKIVDYLWIGCIGGGIVFIFCDILNVKKVDGG